MTKLMTFGASMLALAMMSTVQLAAKPGDRPVAGPVPNPAMNLPDMVAWDLFTQVVQPAPSLGPPPAGKGLLPPAPMTFETWASDELTFGTAAAPVFPRQLDRIAPRTGRPTLMMGHGALTRGAAASTAQLAPNTLHDAAREEVRRNRAAFDYIVQNRLWTVTGLQAAFGKTIKFPIDSIEVKTNWLNMAQMKQYYPRAVAGTEAAVRQNFAVVTGSDGLPYAMVSMHVISKLVPNWTWATFEHQANPGRCDIIGCVDSYGAQRPNVRPQAKPEQGYGPCAKTPAVANLMKSRKLAPQLANYCLKGSQTDFTDPTGVPIRLGNSVTEGGFVDRSSCMTCHGTAGWDRTGSSLPINTPIGAIPASVYWTGPTNDARTSAVQFATSADFVWSIPFCAFDDTPGGAGANTNYNSNDR